MAERTTEAITDAAIIDAMMIAIQSRQIKKPTTVPTHLFSEDLW